MITYNEFGEVVAVNGIITGHNIGTPLQDATPEKPEDNDCYAEERCTITNACNTVLDAQPVGDGVQLPELSNPASAEHIVEGYEAVDGDGNKMTGSHICESGGAEFKTCTMRFVPYSYSNGWETFEAAKVYNNYGYTKCVDGVISAELVRGDAATTNFDITIENVLCGSLLFFSSNAEAVNTDDANGGGWDEIDPTHFFAPAEANVVCTIKLGVPGDGGW